MEGTAHIRLYEPPSLIESSPQSFARIPWRGLRREGEKCPRVWRIDEFALNISRPELGKEGWILTKMVTLPAPLPSWKNHESTDPSRYRGIRLEHFWIVGRPGTCDSHC